MINFNIESCEECENLTLLDDNAAKKKTYNCPICGCINLLIDYDATDKTQGMLQIVKPHILADIGKSKNGVLEAQPFLDDEEKAAIVVLRKNGWTVKFIEKKK